MHIRARQHGADGYATAGRIQLQFVAFPANFVTLCVFLRACGAKQYRVQRAFAQASGRAGAPVG